MNVVDLKATVRQAMQGYARRGLNSSSTLMHSDDDSFISVVTVPDAKEAPAFTSLLVRISGDTIIVERDQNSKPLVDALVQAGIPRSRIILVYAGEAISEGV
jgi:hypothetical protein